MAQLLSVDVRTMLLLLGLGNLAAACLLLVSAGRLRDTPHSLYGLARLLQGLAWPLLALRGEISLHLSLGLANCLLLAGFWLETVCVRALDNSGRTWPAALRVVLLAAGVSLSVSYLVPQANLRVALGSALGALSCTCTGGQLLRGRPAPSLLRRSLGWAYLVLCTTLFVRAGAALLREDVTLFTQGLGLTISYIPLYLLMIAGSFGLLLVFKETADERLTRHATRDPLTGAPNRRSVLEAAYRLAALAHRGAQPMGVLMLDIDHFKQVNDTHGHDVGDLVLKDLVRLMAESLRAYDAYGRYGGEEFLAVLPGAGLDEAKGVAERIRAAAEASRPTGEGGVRYTVSVGVAWGIPEPGGLGRLLRHADQALYAAKGQGRNRVATRGELEPQT